MNETYDATMNVSDFILDHGEVCPSCGGVIRRVLFDRGQGLTCPSCSWTVLSGWGKPIRDGRAFGFPEPCAHKHRGSWSIRRFGHVLLGRCQALTRNKIGTLDLCSERANLAGDPQGFFVRPRRERNSSKAVVAALLSQGPMDTASLVEEAANRGLTRGQALGVLRRLESSLEPYIIRVRGVSRPEGGHPTSVYQLSPRGHLFVEWASKQGLLG